MPYPIRAMLALFVIGAFGGIAVWGLVAVLQAERLTEAQRMLAAGGIVLAMASSLALFGAHSLRPTALGALRSPRGFRNEAYRASV